MSQQPVDLTTRQPAVSSEPLDTPPPPPRQVGIQQLIERLAATATERAATADGDRKQKLERVARLAAELNQALSDVEVERGPGGYRPA
jgi:hypothetical protein